MGLAGLRAFATVDSGMPTVTAARPFRWGWRCLGEQRTGFWKQFTYLFRRSGQIIDISRGFLAAARARRMGAFVEMRRAQGVLIAVRPENLTLAWPFAKCDMPFY